MISTTKFFIWFFEGLGGIGGWIIFFLISAAAVLYIFVDSSRRKMPALGWQLGSLLLALLVVPAGVFRFVSPETQATLLQYLELLFYLGIIGGIVPFFIALGYMLHFRGFAVCPNGHLYEPALGDCMECLSDEPMPVPSLVNPVRDTEVEERQTIFTQVGQIFLPFKSKEKAQAFLLLPDGHTYQLNKGTTLIGRDQSNDFVFLNKYVGRSHSKIVEEGKNLFRIYDLGTKNFTWLNGRKIDKSVLLETDDELRFGQEVKATFLVSSKH
jgi:hypothetical protein